MNFYCQTCVWKLQLKLSENRLKVDKNLTGSTARRYLKKSLHFMLQNHHQCISKQYSCRIYKIFLSLINMSGVPSWPTQLLINACRWIIKGDQECPRIILKHGSFITEDCMFMFVGNALLILTASDTSADSYYGEQGLHYVAVNGESCLVQRRKYQFIHSHSHSLTLLARSLAHSLTD